MMNNKRFLNAEDVASYMDISISMAYKIIRSLNEELNAQGFLTVNGRVSRVYFEKKIFGGFAA